MKPFALDTVLSYRQRLEDIAKNNLALALQYEAKAQKELFSEQDKYRALVATIERVQQQGVNIIELIKHEEHLTYTKNRVKELEKALKTRRDNVIRSRRELLKKARERQIMEKLKEQQNSEWKKHLSKKEAAILDEIAIIFHNK